MGFQAGIWPAPAGPSSTLPSAVAGKKHITFIYARDVVLLPGPVAVAAVLFFARNQIQITYY